VTSSSCFLSFWWMPFELGNTVWTSPTFFCCCSDLLFGVKVIWMLL
jgi:hypothetical protein